MAIDPRLGRLRALVAQLERLPASSRRDRTLMDVRARIADLETGQKTHAMRQFDVESGERAPSGPVQRPASRSERPPSTSERPASTTDAPRARAVAPDADPWPFGAEERLSIEDRGDDGSDRPWRRGLRG